MTLILKRYGELDRHGMAAWRRLPRGPRYLLFVPCLLEYALFYLVGFAILGAIILLMFVEARVVRE
ncbi:hypothetical protein HHL25_21790 [Rhizobium sp. S-51]|uniref:Uncharacterized protein n=1 Tax=Rhizobium terricola TaxID=2728849 RepID=A0A7Y0B0H1_9HYPH|nr:hypothetical protein [Rhizobium terricola]NML76775.1 hypothetical protein [Rhizobium terricola]